MPAFTALAVELQKPDPGKRLELPDSTLLGFYLLVQPSGAKSWAVRYRADGKCRQFTLEPYPRLGLADARERARAALQAVSEGRDPAGEQAAVLQEQAAAARLTFGAVVADFITRYAKPRNRSWPESERLLSRGDLAQWQGRDIRSIGWRDVLDVIDGMVKRGSPVQANRQFAAMRKLFAWTVERGILDASPMATLKPPSPEIARDRVLTDTDLRAVWLAAAEIGYPFGHAVQLLILTGQRRAEVLEAEWREFDLDARMRTIPRQWAKNDRAHAVALADPAFGILTALPRVEQLARFLFTTTGSTPFSGISKASERLAKLAAAHMPAGQELKPWRLHDLRRTFASGCARLGVSIHVVEKILNHTSGTFGGIAGVYQRHDFAEERQQAFVQWAAFVLQLVKPV